MQEKGIFTAEALVGLYHFHPEFCQVDTLPQRALSYYFHRASYIQAFSEVFKAKLSFKHLVSAYIYENGCLWGLKRHMS